MRNLNSRTWRSLVGVALVMGLLLFLAAGTAHYWQAWCCLVVVFAAWGLLTLYLMRNDPALLKRRSSGGATAEKETSQKIIMAFTTIGFIALLVVPGLDHRFNWSRVPVSIVIAGDFLMMVGFYIIFLVFKENTFASATIEIATGQQVVSTGPYAVVRHPMYAGGLLYLLAMPLALGSWWGVLVVAAIAPFLAWRLLDEERFLSKNLPGYDVYCSTIRWRLIPGVF
jgi:protein-S-isoprenylcysteine O-methyltransferase Ste14